MSLALRNAIIKAKKDPDKLTRAEALKYVPEKVFGPGRTKQSFKDSTDVNKILAKHQKAGTMDHLSMHGAEYGDFSQVDDLLSAHERLGRGKEIFDSLPVEVRNEFQNDMFAFFRAVNDPANKDRLHEFLPRLAEPDRYFVDVSPRTPPGALLGERASLVERASPEADTPPEEPSTASEGN